VARPLVDIPNPPEEDRTMRRNWKWLTAVIAVFAILTAGATVSSAATITRKVSILSSGGTYPTFSFSPKTKTIHKDVRIKWSNQSGYKHHIKFTNGVTFSKVVPIGGSVSLVFHHKGTFHYHCTIHPYMKGVIKVT
jgi:plastocyanin